jgi:uncharacterized protein (UPF0261 family)
MTETRKHIGVLCTLDTKSEHAGYVKTLIESRGHRAVIIDTGVLGDPHPLADKTRSELARAAGVDIRDLVLAHDRGAALSVMATGAASIVVQMHRSGQLDGLLGLGGGSGTAIATAAMRAVPIGVPKVMISTMASTPKAASYVGTSDIVMVNTITDLIGMNPIIRGVLANGAGAICGMVEMGASKEPRKRGNKRPATVAITAFGVTTEAAMRCRTLLTRSGCETMVFHANGTGGRAMEELIAHGAIDAVLDLTITELADELCGGLLSAGPRRLEAAGIRGIPQVVLPGAIDMVNFATPDTVPEKYRSRQLYAHSPNTTLMRTTAGENAALGRQVGEKLSGASRRAVLILPLLGFSEYDRAGGVFDAPDADLAFIDAAVSAAEVHADIVRLEANINDPSCAETAVAWLLRMLSDGHSTASEVDEHAQSDNEHHNEARNGTSIHKRRNRE